MPTSSSHPVQNADVPRNAFSRPVVAVVEDNPSMLAALGRFLRAAGFDTVLHASAEDYLKNVPATCPTCMVVDVQLGGMSGLELQSRLLAQKSNVPVIFITAHDERATRLRAAALGCRGYLCKPFEGQQLLDLINLQEDATQRAAQI